MSDTNVAGQQPGDRLGVEQRARDRGDVVVRLNTGAWVVACVAFALGVLVGLVLD